MSVGRYLKISEDETDYIVCKKIRCEVGLKHVQLSRLDIVSEEGWQPCLEIFEHKNNQIKAARQKSYRERNKVKKQSIEIDRKKKSVLLEFLQVFD